MESEPVNSTPRLLLIGLGTVSLCALVVVLAMYAAERGYSARLANRQIQAQLDQITSLSQQEMTTENYCRELALLGFSLRSSNAAVMVFSNSCPPGFHSAFVVVGRKEAKNE
jgi:hypothetical protein